MDSGFHDWAMSMRDVEGPASPEGPADQDMPQTRSVDATPGFAESPGAGIIDAFTEGVEPWRAKGLSSRQ